MSNRRNRKTVFGLLAILGVMGGLVSVSAPLYRIFCGATGYEGTTQRASVAPANEVKGRVITIRFEADTATDLPWSFQPEVREVTVHPGEQKLVAYRAVNHSAEPITGRATYNVTPDKAGLYFDKLQCFCFSNQYLAPGQSAELTVSFFVDPDIVKDPNTIDVNTITLSYTMFRAKSDGGPAANASSPGETRVN
ncbi:MAG TPA: cytochrome c oxidase assembly protein [Stellaceae bacterium]|nr:cytochrome c oxidase assembly protein [Stellaceae bacterium]